MKYPMVIIVFLLSLSCNKENVYTQEPNLLGTWELVRYEDKTGETFRIAPENEKPISITFKETSFEGSTDINVFYGDYSVKPGLLTFNNFNGSEAGESDWGQKFYDSIRLAYDIDNKIFGIDYIMEGNNLKFEYEPAQFMVFVKS